MGKRNRRFTYLCLIEDIVKNCKMVENILKVIYYNWIGGEDIMSHTISHKISEKRRIGYCRNKAHKGFITSATLGEHKCLEKGCTYFQRFEDSQYWK